MTISLTHRFFTLTLAVALLIGIAPAASAQTSGTPSQIRIGFQKSSVKIPRHVNVASIVWQPTQK
ncbi:MAG: hypothetical protein WAN92_03885 [Herbaspirillum sp.]